MLDRHVLLSHASNGDQSERAEAKKPVEIRCVCHRRVFNQARNGCRGSQQGNDDEDSGEYLTGLGLLLVSILGSDRFY